MATNYDGGVLVSWLGNEEEDFHGGARGEPENVVLIKPIELAG